jgi:hypothetical protein
MLNLHGGKTGDQVSSASSEALKERAADLGSFKGSRGGSEGDRQTACTARSNSGHRSAWAQSLNHRSRTPASSTADAGVAVPVRRRSLGGTLRCMQRAWAPFAFASRLPGAHSEHMGPERGTVAPNPQCIRHTGSCGPCRTSPMAASVDRQLPHHSGRGGTFGTASATDNQSPKMVQ